MIPSLRFLAAGVALFASATAPAQTALPLDRIKLPPGFTIELVARVPEARAMTFGTRGTLFVGSKTDKAYAVVLPPPGSRASAQVKAVASGLTLPVGVAFRDGALYVSSVDRIVRLDDVEARLDDPPRPVVVTAKLPADRWHGWKFIAFGPDGKLYVAVGAPCNVCDRDADGHAGILHMNADGSGIETIAHGVRNTVGFDWHPVTHELWFTDNGRDMLGDDVPPDELNHLTRTGQHFGFPFCHGGTIPDPEFSRGRSCAEFVPPVQVLGAHVAALGMRFYTGSQFPPQYRGQVFIAEHGSWNRSTKSGYRITVVTLDPQGRATRYAPFAEGWVEGERSWGRPADVVVAPDGSLLVSDDQAGAVYRIRYGG